MTRSLRRAGLTAAVVALATTALLTSTTTTAGAAPAAATGSLTGRLTTASGAPAVGAVVDAYTVEDSDYAGRAVTGDDGGFAFTRLPADAYRLEISPETGATQYYKSQVKSLFEADTVTVPAGGTVAIADSLVPSGRLGGVVRDATGEPAADVEVSAEGDRLGARLSGRTDEEGRFSVPAFADTYKVAFTLPGNWWATQWAPRTLDADEAATYPVTADTETALDVDLLPTGSLTGKLTDHRGRAVRDASVSVNGVGFVVDGSESTNARGQFTVSPVFAGDYTVKFSADGAEQWAHGQLTAADATVVTVRPGPATVVDEALLAPGSVRVRAVDASTGAPLSAFCASYNGADVCTTTGAVLLPGVPRGRQEIHVFSRDGYLHHEWVPVQVGAGTTEATVTLRPAGALAAKVVDRSTGKPVADVCLAATRAGQPNLPDGFGDCSAADGTVRVDRLDAGDYTIFARPSDSSGLGAQWVGAQGGTGDPHQAQVVRVQAGATSPATVVTLDRGGAIAGAATSAATGRPVENGYVHVSSYHPGVGPSGGSDTDEDGRYRLDNLGPYPWALYLTASDHAPQWSGGAPTRRLATTVTVAAGRTTTFDPALAVGTEVTGTVRDNQGQPLPNATVFSYNAASRETTGSGWGEDGRYRMLVMGPQTIKLEYHVSRGAEGDPIEGWFGGATDFAGARPVEVARFGASTVDITVATD